MINRECKHLALAWMLIGIQLFFGVWGHGRMVVCREDGGQSRIELIQEKDSSFQAASHCDQTLNGTVGIQVGICSGTPCVDEPLGFTNTTSRLGSLLDSQVDWVLSDTPMLLAIVPPPWTLFTISQSTYIDREAVSQGLHCSIRTDVLIL